MSLEQLQKLREDLAGWEAQTPRNQSKIDAITAEIARLEQETAIQEQAHEERVNQVVSEFDGILQSLDFSGLTLRQIIGGENEYQLITIELKKVFVSQAEQFSRQITELQQSYTAQTQAAQERERQYQMQVETLQSRVNQQATELEETNKLLNEERFNRAQAEQYRDNAASQAEELRRENERLNSHVDDLRQEIAVGARGAIQVVDTAEEERIKKELAEKIRKERTIYNKRWVNEIKKNRYIANLANTGEEIEFNWTEAGKYFEINESEVSSFRSQYQSEPASTTETVVQEPVQSNENVNQGEQFQQGVEAPPIAAVNPVQSESTDGTVVQKTLEDRVAELEKAVFGKANVA